MHNGAKVEIEKLTKRHQENFTIPQTGNESVRPKEQHKESRGSPNRDSNIDNELQHFLKSPFVFCIYIIPYSTIKKQRISGKVYVKFAAGRFINIDLT